ncbi:protein translocase subunit yidC [Tepidamorphus gemmatus]|uniref:Membrane protein insertase YidC n=1 Tax=Tepidamorphus gemmatus TaxID=747076 RepID=A0A4R3M927_9HYPH|nr:membrane protein insertase YidC [Tepidamorphus gemmatus]TCT08789.1 protein translocase subunit yidC [Tepidamorphus gemmatus]
MGDNRNYILAIALSLVILIAWQYFYAIPQMERQQALEQARQQQAVQMQSGQAQSGDSLRPGSDGSTSPATTAPGSVSIPATGTEPATATTREAALAQSARIAIDNPLVRGSISLRGGRIDDVVLKDYRVTVKPDSPNIVLLSPSGSPDPYYVEYGWVAETPGVEVPGPQTVWTAPEGARLTPDTPLTLTWTSDQGLEFTRQIAIDANYMFTVTDSVRNTGDTAVSLLPYGLVSRHGMPHVAGFYILHEGLIGVLGQHGLQEIDYSDLDDGPQRFTATGGWLGITDKYWAAVLVPDQKDSYEARFISGSVNGKQTFQADFLRTAMSVAPGATAETTSYLFAGAKRVDLIDGYETALGIDRFELLIDWGWFYFLTKPLFFVIDYFYQLVGNFGVAILITTILVKLFFFPLANKSYISMSRMKLVQPQMLEIRERYKDDKMKQQQAMMELYRKEKINPLSGCLPILLQIPVFFALYKVLFVTIEMRHAPFFGWIQDLSAPDPTTIFNLFGLIPWDPPSFLMIGVWPLIMGFTMWIQMRLNPPPPDPTQAMIFNWMPVVFTFMLASFPAGLVIYWAWNNTLSVLQQYVIMRRQGVKPDLFGNVVATFSARKRAEIAKREADLARQEAERRKAAQKAKFADEDADKPDQQQKRRRKPKSGKPASSEAGE